jgi:FKBP-type peptidyl-prolyl cis-trans isomerase FkpA
MHFRQALLLLCGLAFIGCGSPPKPTAKITTKGSTSAEPIVDAGPAPSETLDTEDLTVGTGALAETGKRVRMYYVGKLTDGTEFDRTLRRPFEFQLGAGEVITGWDQGIVGMRVGGKRKLVIPGDLGYGARGLPPSIPPNATLVFEVELLDVQ